MAVNIESEKVDVSNIEIESEVDGKSESSPFIVRAYQPSDYAQVLALWEEAKLRPFTEGEVLRLLASGGQALVAVEDAYLDIDSNDINLSNRVSSVNKDKVVGVVLWSHNGSIGILWRLAVAEAARGRGIATRLLDCAEENIRAAGLSGVSLLTRVDNTIAKGMYGRRGYRWNDHLEFWGKKLTVQQPGRASAC